MGLTVEAPPGYVPSLPEPPPEPPPAAPHIADAIDDAARAREFAALERETHQTLDRLADDNERAEKRRTGAPRRRLTHDRADTDEQADAVTRDVAKHLARDQVGCYQPWAERTSLWLRSGDTDARRLRPWCKDRTLVGNDASCMACSHRISAADVDIATRAHTQANYRRIVVRSAAERERTRKRLSRAGHDTLVAIPQAHLAQTVIYATGGDGQHVGAHRLRNRMLADLLLVNGGKVAWAGRVRELRKGFQGATRNSDNTVLSAVNHVDSRLWLAIAGKHGAAIVEWDGAHPYDETRATDVHFPTKRAFDAALDELDAHTRDDPPPPNEEPWM